MDQHELDELARAQLAHLKSKKRAESYWAILFGCCGCALLAPLLLIPIGLFL